MKTDRKRAECVEPGEDNIKEISDSNLQICKEL